MAALPPISSSFLPAIHHQNPQLSLFHTRKPNIRTSRDHIAFKIQAAKLPAGVELPKVEPKFKAPFAGFTRTAEIWNSRACMIGLIGTFIVELILNRGILQLIGVEIGKGLDIPL